MPNNYFQFKQFIVRQQHCAMKVTTDGCLFGALVTDENKNSKVKTQNALDIGTGTGLLSLMLAQKTNFAIDAVEIDAAAYEQAKENFEQSPWKDRLHIFNTDIKDFHPDYKYDFIISNPPFYENDLQSPDDTVNKARHDDTLTLADLLKAVVLNLSPDGCFGVLLPYSRSNYLINEAEKLLLHCRKQVLVKQTPAHNYFRSVLFFSFEKIKIENEEIIIKDENNNYTASFVHLLKDYYLHL